MASFEISRRIASTPEHLYRSAHYDACAWDPLGQRMQCMHGNASVLTGNRVKCEQRGKSHE